VPGAWYIGHAVQVPSEVRLEPKTYILKKNYSRKYIQKKTDITLVIALYIGTATKNPMKCPQLAPATVIPDWGRANTATAMSVYQYRNCKPKCLAVSVETSYLLSLLKGPILDSLEHVPGRKSVNPSES
jgi:hypothetical protein